MLLYALIDSAFAGGLPEHDVVLQLTITSVAPAAPKSTWEAARAVDLRLAVRSKAQAWVCGTVDAVIDGDWFGDETCFFLASNLAEPVVGDTGIWLFRAPAKLNFMLVDDPRGHQPVSALDAIKPLLGAPSTKRPSDGAAWHLEHPELSAEDLAISTVVQLDNLDTLRAQLRSGSAADRFAALDAFVKYGLIPLVPDVIAAIDDPTPITKPGEVLGRPTGLWAATAMGRVGASLEGAPVDVPALDPVGLDWNTRHASVRAAWDAWWIRWSQSGPVVPVE